MSHREILLLRATSDFAIINLGQLKYVAQPFLQQLLNFGYTGHPLEAGVLPWLTGTAGAPNDFAAANLGQLKNLFSFDLTSFTPDPLHDGDGNGLPDSWEYQYTGTTGNDPDTLTPGGITLAEAYALGLDPTKSDNDGDGVADGQDQYPTDPNRSQDIAVTPLAVMDHSGDTTSGNDVKGVAINDIGQYSYWWTDGDNYHVVFSDTDGTVTEGSTPKSYSDSNDGGTIDNHSLSLPVGVSAGGVIAGSDTVTTTSNGVTIGVKSNPYGWNVRANKFDVLPFDFGNGSGGNSPFSQSFTPQGITADGVIYGAGSGMFYDCFSRDSVIYSFHFIGTELFPKLDVTFAYPDGTLGAPNVLAQAIITSERGDLAPQAVCFNGSNAAGLYVPVLSETTTAASDTAFPVTVETGSTAFKIWTGGTTLSDAFTMSGTTLDTSTHAAAINNDGTTTGTSPYETGTNGWIAFAGSGAQSILDLIPQVFQKQIRNITPLLISNSDPSNNYAYHLKFRAQNLEGGTDAPSWINRNLLLTKGLDPAVSGSDTQLSVVTLSSSVSSVSGDPMNMFPNFAFLAQVGGALTIESAKGPILNINVISHLNPSPGHPILSASAVCVGEQVTLSITGTTGVQSYAWNIVNAIAGFNPTNPDGSRTPSNPAVSLTATTGSSVQFYYAIPPLESATAASLLTSGSAPISCDVVMTDGTHHLSGALQILVPTVEVTGTQEDNVRLAQNYSGSGFPAILDGLYHDSRYGFSAHAGVLYPPALFDSGSTCWAQVVTIIHLGESPTSFPYVSTDSTNSLDTSFPYPRQSDVPPPTPQDGGNVWDSPDFEPRITYPEMSEFDETFDAKMYYMWRPATAAAIWVPVKALHWHWNGEAIYSGEWVLTPTRYPQSLNTPIDPAAIDGKYSKNGELNWTDFVISGKPIHH